MDKGARARKEAELEKLKEGLAKQERAERERKYAVRYHKVR